VFGYYLNLAIRSLKRNTVLTVLMVAAVGVGIGVCMTALTTLRAMSGNPIPDKSSHLFVPDINAWDPVRGKPGAADSQFSYRDATALLKAHRGVHQVAMYQAVLNVSTPGGKLVPTGRERSFDPSLGCSLQTRQRRGTIVHSTPKVCQATAETVLHWHVGLVRRNAFRSGEPVLD
jgi:hypothetical protein